MLTLQVELI